MRYTPAMPKAAKDRSSRSRGKPNGGSVKYKSPRLENAKSFGLFKRCPCRRQVIFVKEREQCLALFRKRACTSTTGHIWCSGFTPRLPECDWQHLWSCGYLLPELARGRRNRRFVQCDFETAMIVIKMALTMLDLHPLPHTGTKCWKNNSVLIC